MRNHAFYKWCFCLIAVITHTMPVIAQIGRVDELLKPFMPTAIETIKAGEHSDDNYYDLNGRRVNPSTMPQGFYIHNHEIILQLLQ